MSIRIGDYNVTAPMHSPPKLATIYYIPNFAFACGYEAIVWEGRDIDFHRLKNGIVHSKLENAEIHYKALISLTKIED